MLVYNPAISVRHAEAVIDLSSACTVHLCVEHSIEVIYLLRTSLLPLPVHLDEGVPSGAVLEADVEAVT